MFTHKLTHKLLPMALSAMLISSASVITAYSAAETSTMKGDINTDGCVNNDDLSVMSHYLSGTEEITKQGFLNADMDGDGTVDSLDLIKLRKLVIKTNQAAEITSALTTTTTAVSGATVKTIVTSVGKPLSAPGGSKNLLGSFSSESDFIDAPLRDMSGSLSSEGAGRVCIFYVDFPDCPYGYDPSEENMEDIVFGDEDKLSQHFPHESINAFYSRSSKGRVSLSGEVYRYTAKYEKSNYEDDMYKLKIIDEVLTNMDETVDFSSFDGNNDKVIDTIIITVPEKAGSENWWPCSGKYAGSLHKTIDDVSLGNIIIGNAEIKNSCDHQNFVATYIHELGHSMGLPDYYLYGQYGSEGLHGSAGFDTMDELCSDFSCASKLMLGWYKKDQVQVYDYDGPDEQTFTLTDGQSDSGNCLIIPYKNKLDEKYCSEYMIMEYTTLNNNNKDIPNVYSWQNYGSGIRILHVNAEAETLEGFKDFLFKGSKQVSNEYAAGRRFVRVVNDANVDNLFRTGSVVTNEIPGFAFYGCAGDEVADPEVVINVGELVGDSYTVTISKKG